MPETPSRKREEISELKGKLLKRNVPENAPRRQRGKAYCEKTHTITRNTHRYTDPRLQRPDGKKGWQLSVLCRTQLAFVIRIRGVNTVV